MKTKPMLIGVTGGIGSGKSTVCKVFEVLGHLVYYADDRARWLMNHHEDIKKHVVQLFGEEAYENQRLNRKFIADRVFSSPEMLQELNRIVHPIVAHDLRSWVRSNKDEAILFDEAALMFEVGSYKHMDATILVVAESNLRIDRVMQRDARSKSAIQDIMNRQLSDDEKMPLADFVIRNDGKESLIEQTLSVYHQLT